ncbi:MAG: HDOD domain-containing protein [Candidatus Hydrogenedentes bacterium]|nr:HDOD domain-containing protein [Candidatus Hydrogenedentota bacterium]
MNERNTEKKRIGDLLIGDGLISQAMLDEALQIQRNNGGKVVEILVSLGHLKIDDFINFLSRQPGIASIDLAHYQIPRAITELVPKDLAVKHEVFPIDKMGKLLTLGMACPLDSKTIGQIEEVTGLRVKPILCSQHDIRIAIKNYYPSDESPAVYGSKPGDARNMTSNVTTSKARSGLKLKQASKMIKDLTSLPALPDTVSRVQEATGDLDISPKEVAETIVRDPSIAVKVLSVANSAAYGFPSRVDSIELAVALLGLRETYSIVLSAAVLDLFEVTKHFDYREYWKEAMSCAAAARIIGDACGHKKDPSLFTAGLLHDIGRIALLETVPDVYRQVPSNLYGSELIEAEQKIVGITHTEAGYELAMNWGLPKEIAEPIRHHHHPESAYDVQLNVAIVALAEKWTRTIVRGDAWTSDALSGAKELLDIIGMDESIVPTTFDIVSALEPAHFAWDVRQTTTV